MSWGADAIAAQEPAHFINRCGAGFDKPLPNPMQGLEVSVLRVLDRLKARHGLVAASQTPSASRASVYCLFIGGVMAYLLVPHGVTDSTATIWIAAVNQSLKPVQLLLNGNDQHIQWAGERWTSQNGMYTLEYQRVPITGLEPRKSYALELRVGGTFEARGQVSTLPTMLPRPPEKPFTILLGSCFCAPRDESGRVGNTYFHLPSDERPDVKILCGDQVYLDYPTERFLLQTHTAAEMEIEFFENYMRAWGQSGIAAGFRELLRDGANYFSSDDHELWNNAPNPATLILDSWTSTGREDWLRVGRELYHAFQSASPVEQFSVLPLSFCIADTRINRDGKLQDFMLPGDLNKVGAWINALQGPGVLVLGQPILTEEKGFWGRFSDWNLPNYAQYRDLVQVIRASRHTIVILTGDVHYGRVASCPLSQGVELIEIISSPTALVNDLVGKKWKEAPDFFPANDIPGIVKAPVRTERGFRLTDNHFLTLQFSAFGARVDMTVKAWPTTNPGSLPTSTVVYERSL
jgi:hypothetical protein